MDARGGQDGAAAVVARTARAAGMDPGGRLAGGRPLSARPRSARTGHPFTAGVGPDASRDRAHPDRHPPRSARASDQWPSPAITAGRERGGTSRRRRRVVGVASGLADRLDLRFGESVCIGPPKGAKLSGARRRRNAGVSEFQRNFRSRPVILPAGRSRRGAGNRDGAYAQLADVEDHRTSGNGSRRRLVIVESPTKARKLASYLGSRYIVEFSRRHIRDLPRAAADVPAKFKSEPWARLGVNVDADFEPLYIISPEKKSTVTELKGLLKDVDELYLATDGDREGEAIAWHLLETLKPNIPVKRMVFHEITEPAIRAAAENPRDLDIDLVDAQETRRILDRLYGYEVSPVLWKKVAPRLSAGRVQSVATRIIVQRERDRMAFRSAAYWDIVAQLDARVSDPKAQPPTFNARLTNDDGLRVAGGRHFDPRGQLRNRGGESAPEVTVLDEARATELALGLRGAQLSVASAECRPDT